jgi:hypothetical protein
VGPTQKLLAERKALGTSEEPPVEITLFEYDRRFQQAHPDEFVFYDYKHPTEFGDGSQSNNSVRQHASVCACVCTPLLANVKNPGTPIMPGEIQGLL